MNKQISKQQVEMIQRSMESKKEDDDYSMTQQDQILDLFLPVKVGIYKNGLTAEDISEAMGAKSFKEKAQIRTQICNLVSALIKDGFPFGGLKDGRLKKYGFSKRTEFDRIEMDRKQRMIFEISAGAKYLDDDDPILPVCNKFIQQCDKQLKLFYDKQ
jgi:hypothetical protein